MDVPYFTQSSRTGHLVCSFHSIASLQVQWNLKPHVCLLLVILSAIIIILLLSHFSRVRLCATPETAAHQAPPSLGFSRQEHWNGLPFPSPMHESEKWKWSRSVVSTLSDPMDCSPPGSSVHGIFQARVLEWGAIALTLTLTLTLTLFPV